MTDTGLVVEPVTVRDGRVLALVDALTDELAKAGYSQDETFGYSPDELEQRRVHLVGARRGEELVGVAGLEVLAGPISSEAADEPAAAGGMSAELKRFYVDPVHRGTGVADLMLETLLQHARSRSVVTVVLETGDQQHAARAFYRRHGFREVARFGPYSRSAASVCMRRDLA